MPNVIIASQNQQIYPLLSYLYEKILAQCGGLWVKWDGNVLDNAETLYRDFFYSSGNTYDTLTFPLTQMEHEEGYMNYIIRCMGQVINGRSGMPTFSSSSQIGYMKFNEIFAKSIIEYVVPDDIIWLQDFDFIPCVKMLRSEGLLNPVGIFFHQPFPDARTFESLPNWRYLADSLLCADLIGFETERDLVHFSQWITDRFSCTKEFSGLRINGNLIRMKVLPIGINTGVLRTPSKKKEWLLRGSLHEMMILSTGSPDNQVADPHHTGAFEILLTANREYADKLTMLHLLSEPDMDNTKAPGLLPRSHAELIKMESIFLSADSHHVICYKQGCTPEAFFDLYRMARVALITTMVSGASLMAKDFIAAQDPANPGVLIISESFSDLIFYKGALVVNPLNNDSIAEAIHAALQMPLSTRLERYNTMMQALRLNSWQIWSEKFIALLSLCNI